MSAPAASSPLRGHLSAMPFLVVNLGVEMLYILQQRLRAQAIDASKSRKVLVDVVTTIFKPHFVDELFRPQEAYSVRATRQVFDRVAHSSIMRLNKASMDKLFDLMTMGVKLQVLACPSPQALLLVTLTHLDGLRAVVADDAGAVALLADSTRRCVELYSRMATGELFALRHTLCRFFQDRHVKVSLFLEDGLQRAADGTIFISTAGPLPTGSELPGTVRYFARPEASGSGGGKGAAVAVAAVTERVAGKAPAPGQLPPSAETSWPLDASQRPNRLGSNFYVKERKKDAAERIAAAAAVGSPAGAAAGEALLAVAASRRSLSESSSEPSDGDAIDFGAGPGSGGGCSVPGLGTGAGAAAVAAGIAGAGGVQSLNLLASLLGRDESSTDGMGIERLSIFGEDGAGLLGVAGLDDDRGGGSGGGGAGGAPRVGESTTTLHAMMARLGLDDDRSGDGKAGDLDGHEDSKGDDLLSIMDSLS